MVYQVVFHPVRLLHAVVGQVAKQIHIPSCHLRHLQGEMCEEVVTLRVVRHVLSITHIVATVLVFIVHVHGALLVCVEQGMVVCVVILHAVHPHGRHILAQNLETPVLIARRKYQ